MKTKNETVFRGRFSRLKLSAWGFQQVIAWESEIEIYQARISPELWKAKPMMTSGNHGWEASTAQDLMAMVTGDFEDCLAAWTAYPAGRVKPKPSLRRTDSSGSLQAAG
jgi:hypothetical protein